MSPTPKEKTVMTSKFAMLLAAAAIAMAGWAASSGTASAACRPGYKPMKYQNSGNTVCVIDAVAGGNKFKAK
jgi:hypothetical protein